MRRIITTVLAGSLLLSLTACGGKAAGDDLLSRASGVSAAETLLTVDGRAVEAWRYLYWLAYTCDAIQTAYDDAGAELDWDAAYGDGTLADYAGEQALADTVLYAVVETMAEDHGCALTDGDRAALEADWDAAAAAAGGEEAYLAQLSDLGLDRERAETLAATAYLYDQLRARACDPEGADYPTAEDLAEFSGESGWMTVDFIRVDAGDDPDAPGPGRLRPFPSSTAPPLRRTTSRSWPPPTATTRTGSSIPTAVPCWRETAHCRRRRRPPPRSWRRASGAAWWRRRAAFTFCCGCPWRPPPPQRPGSTGSSSPPPTARRWRPPPPLTA